MPPKERRLARAKKLARSYVSFYKWKRKRVQIRSAVQSHRCHVRLPLSLTSIDSASESTASFLASDEENEPLGLDLHQSRTKSLSSRSESSLDCDGEDFSTGYAWSELDTDEDAEDSDPEDFRLGSTRRWVMNQIRDMYARRYEEPRKPIDKPPPLMNQILFTWKHTRPDLFRQQLRITPYTFDKLVASLENDSVWFNHSDCAPQTPVEEQLAVFLYRLGHDGNAASLQDIAHWAGIAKGTVLLFTKRAITAVLRPCFLKERIRMPTQREKEEAKQWIEDHSCRAWRNGWCFVDGTLVPLYARPYWYGESYFDRKCRYSLNVQIVNLPNLRIVDIAYGHTGSTHDSTAFEGTRIASDHERLLADGEWVWADSAYPLQTWAIAPYKKPDRFEKTNAVFNKQISALRIRSEHSIGFFKGRFQSLKNLRINISDSNSHRFATFWIVAAAAIHNFAMECEAEERGYDQDWDVRQDPFLAEGMSSDSESEDPVSIPGERISVARLRAAREKREQLKRKLFRAKPHLLQE